MTPDGAEPAQGRRPQCWLESRAREAAGQLAQAVQPGWGSRVLCLGVSRWGPEETSPGLRADLVQKDR